jgi:DnaK suppressor protein
MAAKKLPVKKSRPSASTSKAKKPTKVASKGTKAAKATRPAVKNKPAKVTKTSPVKRPVAAKAAVAKRPVSKAVPAKKTAVPPMKQNPKAEAKPTPKPASKPAPAKAYAPPAPPAAKPVKQPPLKKADLEYFRNLLLEKRREILGDVGSMESEAFKSGSNLSNMPIHMADVGTDNFEQEFTLGLIESERQILREIQAALGRLDEGKFGICLGTGEMIPRVRLEAVPWAKYTIEYSRKLEQGLIRDESDAPSSDDSDEDDE